MVVWEVRDGRRLGPSPFLCMGIVNVTPDSFSDGGQFLDPAAAETHARRLAEEGADILDVGGESTRPGSDPITAAEEWRRVGPVLEALRDNPPAAAISVDTWRAATAAKALEAGADVINDISACRFDPGLMDVLVQHQPGYVLMHTLDQPKTMQRDPQYKDVVEDVIRFLEDHLTALVKAGLDESRIVLDPGVGFGKTAAHNLALLACVNQIASLGRPVLVGLSRKRFLQEFLVEGETDRANATQAATVLAARNGAAIHRVHDVTLTRQSLAVTAAMLHAAASPVSHPAAGNSPCST